MNDDHLTFDEISLGETSRSALVDYTTAEETVADPSDPQVFGRNFISRVYKILKIGSIYDIDHNQTAMAAEEFMSFFEEAFRVYDEDEISFLVRDELAIVNGQSVRLRRKNQERLNDLRDLFTKADIKGILLKRGMSQQDFLDFIGELRIATRTRGATMEHVSIPTIEIEHGQPVRHLLEKILAVDKAMYVLHVYIRGLVKTKNMHDQARDKRSADIPTGVIRRIMQSISQLLADEDFLILGLLPLRIVPPDLSSHSMNSAIYAMLLADRLSLSPQMVSYVGMATIFQDLDRIIGIPISQRDRSTGLDPAQQFSTNLRDVARMLDRVKGDAVSTLRILTTYERGCVFDDPIPGNFYRRERHLHLISRIVDLCRTYDLLVQGLEGYRTRRPDLAIEYIQARSGEVFDPALVDLLVSTLGIYPIGTTVGLTTGERAVVVQTPDPARDPVRPQVRILNQANPVTIDLSSPEFQHVAITGSVDIDPNEISVSKVFLLT